MKEKKIIKKMSLKKEKDNKSKEDNLKLESLILITDIIVFKIIANNIREKKLLMISWSNCFATNVSINQKKTLNKFKI